MAQMLEHRLGGHGAQIELQTTRQHGDRHFLWVGRGQHKFQILGRLFQGFQHRVESGVGEHVHLVNHEHLEAALHRLVNRLLEQGLHFVHTTVRGGVKFGVIDKATSVDVAARLTHTTRLSGDTALPVRTLAIERFGQHTRHRGFAHTACAGEQIRMVQTLCGQCVGQCLHDMLLPHHFGEGFGAVLASEHEVRHKPCILRGARGRKAKGLGTSA